MVIDQRELSKGISKPSYTCETIKSLMKDFPKKKFFWILGEDQLLKFKSWKNWKWLLGNLVLALCRRPENSNRKKKIFNYLDETIRSLEECGGKVIVLDISPENISSSCIRDLISKRQNPSNILDKAVYEYATKNKLYLN